MVRLVLTAKGRALAARDPVPALSKHAGELAPQEAEAAERALATILGAMQREHGYRPFAVCHSCRHFRRNTQLGAPHWCGLLEEKLNESDSNAVCAEYEAA